ncbi:hypothetical protein L6452_20943 [Arctium lappa]|uniref:Uncharacterized protein n=1 Tax=Arctium lappa TaxID=4217 RepID=A0ACB9BCR7_ARCLA|nr:hypothetical protein L6452_20943 [Arctium lappa]
MNRSSHAFNLHASLSKRSNSLFVSFSITTILFVLSNFLFFNRSATRFNFDNWLLVPPSLTKLDRVAIWKPQSQVALAVIESKFFNLRSLKMKMVNKPPYVTLTFTSIDAQSRSVVGDRDQKKRISPEWGRWPEMREVSEWGGKCLFF